MQAQRWASETLRRCGGLRIRFDASAAGKTLRWDGGRWTYIPMPVTLDCGTDDQGFCSEMLWNSKFSRPTYRHAGAAYVWVPCLHKGCALPIPMQQLFLGFSLRNHDPPYPKPTRHPSLTAFHATTVLDSVIPPSSSYITSLLDGIFIWTNSATRLFSPALPSKRQGSKKH